MEDTLKSLVWDEIVEVSKEDYQKSNHDPFLKQEQDIEIISEEEEHKDIPMESPIRNPAPPITQPPACMDPKFTYYPVIAKFHPSGCKSKCPLTYSQIS